MRSLISRCALRALLATTSVNSYRFLKLLVLAAVCLGVARADADGPDPGLANVPGEAGTCTNCHGSGASSINKNNGSLKLDTGSSSSYVPGEVQHWIVTISDSSARRWGFQAAARQSTSTSVSAGGFVSTDSNTQVICSNSTFRARQKTTTGSCGTSVPLMYAEHTLTGTRNGTTGSITFAFDWHAPATDAGPVTVYLAANAANGNNQDDTGDHIYTATYTLSPKSATSQTPAISDVVNGASFAPGIESGSWVTIKGTNLTSATSCDPSSPTAGCRTWAAADFTNGTPTSLDGVSVTIGGQPAYVYYISPAQINVQAPDLASGSATVVVTNTAGTSNSVTTSVTDFAPAFFLNGTYAIATHQDGSLVASTGAAAGAKPAERGETIVLWGTGFGGVTPQVPAGKTTAQALGASSVAYAATPPAITIGGVQADVVAAGLNPSALGLYQIAITVPNDAPSGDQSIVASVGGKSSPTGVLITVQ